MSDVYFQSHQLQVMQFTSVPCMCLDLHVHDNHFHGWVNTQRCCQCGPPQCYILIWTLHCLTCRVPHACRRYAHGHALCIGDQTGSRKMQTPGPGRWSESCLVRSRSTVSCGSTCVLYMYYGQFFFHWFPGIQGIARYTPLLYNNFMQYACTVLPRLSETSIIRTEFRTWSLYKKVVFLIKIADWAEYIMFVCHTYMFNVCTQ